MKTLHARTMRFLENIIENLHIDGSIIKTFLSVLAVGKITCNLNDLETYIMVFSTIYFHSAKI